MSSELAQMLRVRSHIDYSLEKNILFYQETILRQETVSRIVCISFIVQVQC